MADVAISRGDVVASDSFGAAQMRIRGFFPNPFRQRFLRSDGWNIQVHRAVRWAPQIGTSPIIWIPVIPEVFSLVLPGYGPVRVDVGAMLHLLSRQRHVQPLGLPIHINHRKWRD